MTILPLELIDEVVDEACRVSAANTALQHAIFLSALAGVCTHFRHRVNQTRFKTVSIMIRFSVYSRPVERLAQLEGLINADVWAKKEDAAFSGKGLAQHISSFTVGVMGGLPHLLSILGDGVMARIMRKLFRQQHEVSEHPSKFSLLCNVRNEIGRLSLLDWRLLDPEFIDAFKYMCTTSQLSSLSLHGFREVPTLIIRESVIRQLRVQSVSFERTEEAYSGVSRFIQPQQLKDLTLDGVRFGIPDDNIILRLTSLTACLWDAKELHMLHDILDGISKLEKLCIHIGSEVFAGELVAFDRDLPYLKELAIELETSMHNPLSFASPSPTAFILGTHTPPTVHRIDVHVAILLKEYSPRDDFMEKLRNALDLLNLRNLDQQLQSSILHTAVRHIQFFLSIKLPSFSNVSTLNKADSHKKMSEMVYSLFPLLLDSKKVKFIVNVAIDQRREAWRRTMRNHGI